MVRLLSFKSHLDISLPIFGLFTFVRINLLVSNFLAVDLVILNKIHRAHNVTLNGSSALEDG